MGGGGGGGGKRDVMRLKGGFSSPGSRPWRGCGLGGASRRRGQPSIIEIEKYLVVVRRRLSIPQSFLSSITHECGKFLWEDRKH